LDQAARFNGGGSRKSVVRQSASTSAIFLHTSFNSSLVVVDLLADD
jgi:hypothetical protein